MRLSIIATAATIALATIAPFGAAQAADITGAGATFPAPAYTAWAAEYKAKTGNGLNYQAIGSGGGQTQITNRTVDFGASDAPMAPEKLEAANLLQFPTVVGAVVPIVNLEGVEANKLKLNGEVLGGDLSRDDHQVERPEDRGPQRGRGASRHRHRPGLPFGRLRHDLCVHDLSLDRKPGLEG